MAYSKSYPGGVTVTRVPVRKKPKFNPRSYGPRQPNLRGVGAQPSRAPERPSIGTPVGYTKIGGAWYGPGLHPGGAAAGPPRFDTSVYQGQSDEALSAQAAKQAQDAIDAQAAPIRTAMLAAAARAQGQGLSTIGFSNAARDLLAQISPTIAAQTAQNSKDLAIGGPGGAFNSDYAQPENTAIGNANLDWAGMLGKIQGQTGEQDLSALMAKAMDEQKDYSSQLIDLAAKRPDLQNQILDRLQQHEFDKVNQSMQQASFAFDQQKEYFDEQTQLRKERADAASARSAAAQQAFDNKVTQRQLALKARAQTASERKAAAQQALALEKLKFQSKVAQDKSAQGWAAIDARNTSNRIAIQRLQQQGARIDAQASKVAGHVVLMDGSTPVGKNGKPIAIAATPQTAAAKQKVYGQFVRAAKSGQGKVVTSDPSWATLAPGTGKYVAKFGAPNKGIMAGNPALGIPATTNNPRLAKTSGTMTYKEAVQYYKNAYPGLTDRQIKQGLRAAGWKAPVKKKKRAIPLFGTIGSPGGLQTYQG